MSMPKPSTQPTKVTAVRYAAVPDSSVDDMVVLHTDVLLILFIQLKVIALKLFLFP